MKENQQTISVNKQISVKVPNQKKPQIQAITAIVNRYAHKALGLGPCAILPNFG